MSEQVSPSTCLVLDPDASPMDLYDALTERLDKAECVLAALIMPEVEQLETLSPATLNGIALAVSSLVSEAHAMARPMFEQLQAQQAPKAKGVHHV